ncbi:hypothetical protein [Dictyobacter kobayashii]|uniref:Uncharacterized protein n=1 Tax=Dictyobacter kobayashii TaxID=2014872 RepID=A0A402AXJ8_9CHLR|nr:hypothetical protein [Dictyobacter kobayashii]GCE23818.1 hypothetical protein KDK_76180 [Dictyobacter kobayashii]
MGGQESTFSPQEETAKQAQSEEIYQPRTINDDVREQATTPEQLWQPPWLPVQKHMIACMKMAMPVPMRRWARNYVPGNLILLKNGGTYLSEW